MVEHLTFNQVVRRSSRRWLTNKNRRSLRASVFVCIIRRRERGAFDAGAVNGRKLRAAGVLLPYIPGSAADRGSPMAQRKAEIVAFTVSASFVIFK